MSLTDARKMWRLLNDAGTTGCHSHDLRRQGVSGNPSQRAKDITSKGQPVFTARESRNGRPGARYWLEPYAPDYAVAVKGNHEIRSAAASDEVSKGAPLSSVDRGEEEAAERPARLTWYRNYCEPDGEWEVRAA